MRFTGFFFGVGVSGGGLEFAREMTRVYQSRIQLLYDNSSIDQDDAWTCRRTRLESSYDFFFIGPPDVGKDRVVETVKSFALEYAFLKVFDARNGIAPRVLDIVPGSVSDACRARLFALDRAGQMTLSFIRSSRRREARNQILYKVAIKALEYLRELHELGFAHGDLYEEHMVFSQSPEMAPYTLKFTGFKRVWPLNGTDAFKGFKIHDGPSELRAYWRMSPWEIQSSAHRSSGRDDIFRLAETLIRVGGYDGVHEAQVAWEYERIRSREPEYRFVSSGELFSQAKAFLAAKRSRKFALNTPQVFMDFYQYAVNMGYHEIPNYDEWAQRFNQVIDRTDSEEWDRQSLFEHVYNPLITA